VPSNRALSGGVAVLLLMRAGLSLGAEQTSGRQPLCQVDDTTTILKMDAERTPNYFFRPFPNTNHVSYASASRNFILDLEKGAEVEIPGPYDPVPTPDQMIMTTPPDGGLTFFSIDDLQKGKQEPLLVDDTLKGVYQSIGTVDSAEGEKTFRVITDQDGLSFRDYRIKEGSAPGEKPTVTPLGSAPTVLCKGMRLSLPMLSKDGKHIAALDVDAGVTKIFDIDPSTGTCKESFSLGIPTGKVDFNFNGDEITFHVLNNNSEGDSYFKVPSDSLVANVFVYKRSTGEITRLTNNTGSNSVYPAFRRDGKVVYMNHPQRSGTPGGKSSFVVADPEKANKQPFELTSTPACAPKAGGKSFNAVAALGALWAELCSQYGHQISDAAASLIPLGLDPGRCKKLVDEKWRELKEQVATNAELTKSGRVKADIVEDLQEEDLLAACPKRKFEVVTPGSDSGKGEPIGGGGPRAPVPATCFECHSDDIPFGDFARLSKETAASGKPFREEILDRINRTGRGRMPPGNHHITPEEKQAFERYLKDGVIPK
jgi:hypothetical protein